MGNPTGRNVGWGFLLVCAAKIGHLRREKEVMTYLVFGGVLAAMLSLPFVAMSSNEASAQQRATCSQAPSHSATQPVSQTPYDAWIETGCWKVGLIKRCGYEKEE